MRMTKGKRRRSLLTSCLFGGMVLVGVLLTSCDVESSDNGQLDGFWQLRAADTLATGGHSDLTGLSLTWAFQGRLLELRDLHGQRTDIVSSFSHEGNTLRLFDACIVDRDKGDIRIEEPTELSPYGVNRIDESFTVEHLDASKMVLKSDRLRLTFRKY